MNFERNEEKKVMANFINAAWSYLVDFTIKLDGSRAKIKNKFVSPYPTDPVKIGQLNFFYWKFAITFFSSFRSKFILMKILYFRFVSPKDRYFRITEHMADFDRVGRVRGNKLIFNFGPTAIQFYSKIN
jgi:hypothetical protein